MTMMDRDSQIRIRAESGLALGQIIESALDWVRSRIQDGRRKRQRRKQLDRLLALRDWQLRDVNVKRGDLQAERDALD